MVAYRVYVLECGDGSLYVGSTAHPVAVRVAQHRAGGRLAARVCRRFGVRRVRRALCPGRVYPTRAHAEAAERALAVRLRRRFPVVHQH